ncbi:TLC domain-containing protein 2-like [Babylonia areolata]|uniref:TLC domain-containing protein 2-like n=1 Tax=Babylonia areolata TaxID=304850 RepID=UPI003FD3ABDB
MLPAVNISNPENRAEATPAPSLGCFIIILSAFVFYLASLVSAGLCPSQVARSPAQSWRWKNISVSFLHASISGPLAVVCFWETPLMAEDLISTFSWFSYALISMSVGYFVYDILDMIVCERTRQSWELVGHHIVIIMCFMVAVVKRMYVGYAVVGLVVELNSMFLHLRQLMQICSLSRSGSSYRLNSLINLATFIVFRISTLAWMTRWIVINKDALPLVLYSLGSVGLAVMTLMNIVLFYRLLRSDFFSTKDKAAWKKE